MSDETKELRAMCERVVFLHAYSEVKTDELSIARALLAILDDPQSDPRVKTLMQKASYTAWKIHGYLPRLKELFGEIHGELEDCYDCIRTALAGLKPANKEAR